ncbi:hypothetical protein [Rhodobacter maris]|uniref:Uncharacterized protein n=1 Tax=Rhodobacter maris TaxID=446682 RepID=A0A285TGC6_9RHOB|nr:hypothetical protein [Rhodobacter maris]SOC19631.1 hypothetical protein SAMN05877831_11826 [Rhodobacter maris]
MRDYAPCQNAEPPTNPVALWRRSIESLRAARRQAPIMTDYDGHDELARDVAAEAYVLAAEALVMDLGTLLELGHLDAIEESMALVGAWPSSR